MKQLHKRLPFPMDILPQLNTTALYLTSMSVDLQYKIQELNSCTHIHITEPEVPWEPFSNLHQVNALSQQPTFISELFNHPAQSQHEIEFMEYDFCDIATYFDNTIFDEPNEINAIGIC